ncbi:NADP-dependent 3-hydroxy acid dehydrogenase YdfG [Pseudonocardia thermophila]|uniref:NADP-dependent 3-hydroxy acid dehydrogenase YdfG n=1 Tax=Pseudonocardia thermophila TaxID=1848 RepID=A0A1M7BBA2_PSETH|nr:NADP-dependent 3-hydroxy acid dehydrogenase YdfG [Pseudonocardia thermophila]
MDVSGKGRALVTCDGSGIGRAAYAAFPRHGTAVMAVDRDAAAAEETVEGIRSAACTAVAVLADVSQSADAQAGVEAAVERFGRIDRFANNTPWACFLGLHNVLPRSIAQGGSAMVNTASVAGIIATPGAPVHAVSKHAVIGLIKAATGEVERHGPGHRGVPWTRRRGRDAAAGGAARPDGLTERNRAAQPTGRYSTPGGGCERCPVLLFGHRVKQTGAVRRRRRAQRDGPRTPSANARRVGSKSADPSHSHRRGLRRDSTEPDAGASQGRRPRQRQSRGPRPVRAFPGGTVQTLDLVDCRTLVRPLRLRQPVDQPGTWAMRRP